MSGSDSFVYSSFADELRVKGIRALGYGIVPKAAMLDPALSIQAKAIYAYFCSYSGSGNTLFPSRDRIIEDLGISKNTYYKHFSLLTEQGYITTAQSNMGGKGRANGGGFQRNVYVIENCPSKYSVSSDDSTGDITGAERARMIRVRNDGILTDGYGMYPKAVAKDARLSIQAKALYAYYAVHAGAGSRSWPSKDAILRHLGVSDKSFRTYKHELIDANYISEAREHIDGKLGASVITLITNPDEANASRAMECIVIQSGKYCDTLNDQCGKICDTQTAPETALGPSIVENSCETAFFDAVQCGKYEDALNEDTLNCDTPYISRTNNTGISNIRNHQSKSAGPTTDERKLSHQDVAEAIYANGGIPKQWLGNYSLISQMVRHLMFRFHFEMEDFDMMCAGKKRTHPDEELFAAALVNMLCSVNGFRVNGYTVRAAEVADKLEPFIVNGLEFSGDFVHAATDRMFNKLMFGEEKIENPVAYMMTVIWNLIATGPIDTSLSDWQMDFK